VSLTAAARGTGKDTGQPARDDLAQVRPFELQLFDLINQEREQRGVPPVKLSQKLSGVARRHSQEMRDRKYMGHISPVAARRTPQKRFRASFGYEPYLIGENVARREGTRWCLTADRIEKTHRDLMDSAHHRENILRPEFEHVGIGIAVNESGHYWVTEVFVRQSAPEGQAGNQKAVKQ
jgi:uncharacterized protein YkwD